MPTIEAVTRVRIRHAGREHALAPGERLELPEKNARRLLDKAPAKVRLVTDNVVYEPVTIRNPVYWESNNGELLGPGRVVEISKRIEQSREEFLLCVENATGCRWIPESLLRKRPSCPCCGGTDHWESVYGVRVCARCHPPMSTHVVSVGVGETQP